LRLLCPDRRTAALFGGRKHEAPARTRGLRSIRLFDPYRRDGTLMESASFTVTGVPEVICTSWPWVRAAIAVPVAAPTAAPMSVPFFLSSSLRMRPRMAPPAVAPAMVAVSFAVSLLPSY